MTNLFHMDGKRVLVTGGATGLGFAMSEALADHGAEVIIAARRKHLIDDAVSKICESGGRAKGVVFDVSNLENLEANFDELFADQPIDVLINNAGISGDKMLLGETFEGWDATFNTNLKAVFALSTTVANQMIKRESGGCIINIASILGFTSQKGTATYAATKAGMIHLTKAMAVEWARYGIRVNAIAPGYFRTAIADDFLDSTVGGKMKKRAPMRRTGEPEELAGAALLLASDAGAYMTGSTITVDGGLSINQI